MSGSIDLASGLLKSLISIVEVMLKKEEALFLIARAHGAVRRGMMENTNRICRDGKCILLDRGPDKDIIARRNEAVRRGSFDVDQALFKLGTLEGDEEERLFHRLYDANFTYQATGEFEIDVLSKRGLMAACASFTEHSHDKNADDDFYILLDGCKAHWKVA